MLYKENAMINMLYKENAMINMTCKENAMINMIYKEKKGTACFMVVHSCCHAILK